MDFAVIKPYLAWIMTVLFLCTIVVLTTTDVSRRNLQYKIKKLFPLINGPLTPEQISLISKKAELDLKVLLHDLRNWERSYNEKKIRECNRLIESIQEIHYLTRYKLLTYEQMQAINTYMLSNQPIWNITALEKAR